MLRRMCTHPHQNKKVLCSHAHLKDLKKKKEQETKEKQTQR